MKQGIIGPIEPRITVPEIPRPRELPRVAEGGSFGDTLRQAISAVNEVQKQSDRAIQGLMTGESQDLHATLIAVQKADLSFQMMMQVRNKIVQAYQEIMRMQV
ncbi:MAG: flagellar hook-basal body complex protein FliE [Acidobacteria bacterium]|nr:flagellar hook-basal body complex protein FliE [Acidobacteriota bacterium]